MSMASAAPFSGLSLPAKTAPPPAAGDQGMTRVGTYGGRIASTRATWLQALAWNADTPATAGGRPSAGRVAERGRDGRLWRQVQRVDHGNVQRAGQADGRGVEGVIVDDVVAGLPDHGVDAGKGARGRVLIARAPGQRRGRAWPQGPGIDPGVDHRDPRYLRSGGRVDMDLVRPAGQAAGKVGDKGLRAAALRLTDGRHQRGDDRDLHRAMTLNARSRGGLMPSTS